AQDLAAGGISAPSFTVSGAPVDHTGPLVTGLSASPSQVNTSNEATVTLTAAMSDPSGINMGDGPYFGGGSYGPSIALRSPSGKLRVEAPFTAGLGDQFEARLTLPAGAEPGLWTISSFLVTDKLGNFAHVPNFAGVQVDGIPDLTPPTIQAVLITPAAISLDAGAVAVTVSATITDNLAGIASYPLCAAIDLCLGPTVNLDYGNGAISAALTPTAGSNYSATLTVPATAIPPTATVTISASDNVGNVGSQTQTLQISRTLPRASQRPTINSFPKVHVGQTINATLPLGTAISGSQPISQSWQWQRCTLSNVCSDIPTATNANYAITNADLQHTLRAELILTNAVGTSRAYSGETSPVIP
ncbi:MAG TPA: hypothetical protein VGU02_16875, partial [Gaiellaceae bacterium]|nr:hypothetical protein [Gaiellaceae bacterium]